MRADAGSFRFDDPSGLLQWAGPDRAIVTFTDLAEIEARSADVGTVVSRWVLA